MKNQRISSISQSSMSRMSSISSHYPKKPKPKSHTDLKKKWMDCLVSWVIEEFKAFKEVAKPSFRRMFRSTQEDIDKADLFVTTADAVRNAVIDLGDNVKKATLLGMKNNQVATTTDHWTGPSNETYTNLTSHWVDEEWNLRRAILDSRVFQGRTTGEMVHDDMISVFEKMRCVQKT